ncbi:MAG: macrocin O-methyltransferase [Gammaproteobacteria bacterium]|nr:macrocin O-methyltransferase [Gammaproteobacteria bacterium]NIR85662.1 macrocin O-methyltransferase [Gammaproteobacteria bacterium]NIR90150.1 macrocin O-methyltransferase [Gammaproteobacteria bacterium]NIU06796.1 macrocin O-methyltransferase [Gammaproteobacteria bacterium]NIV53729.1 macrocin O-methyltransferase [Gammaproteobacteria bacterium]
MVVRSLNKLALRFGYAFTLRKLPQYAVRKKALGIPRDMDPEFVDLYEKTRHYTLTSVERMHALYEAVKYVVRSGLPGDLVECGVWRGGSCMLMARTLLALGDSTRKIYLYDTFAGMTRPGEADVHTVDGAEQVSRWEVFEREGYNEWCYAPIEEVHRNIVSTGYPRESVVLVRGAVEETVPKVAPERIALLRLDTDWFRSTYHELEHLYSRLLKNGILIVDDYGAYDGARLAVDRYFSEHNVAMYLHRIDTAGRIGVKTED